MTTSLAIEKLKKNQKVKVKTDQQADEIVYAAWNLGLNAQVDRSVGGWVVSVKR